SNRKPYVALQLARNHLGTLTDRQRRLPVRSPGIESLRQIPPPEYPPLSNPFRMASLSGLLLVLVLLPSERSNPRKHGPGDFRLRRYEVSVCALEVAVLGVQLLELV